MQHLLGCTLCGLDKQALDKLVTASWPNLHVLDLSGNDFGGFDVTCLAKGNWQKLSILKMRGIDLDHHSVAELMKADWPNLGFLTLDISVACFDVYSLLSLAFDNADTSSETLIKLPRSISADLPSNMVVWPRLRTVTFDLDSFY